MQNYNNHTRTYKPHMYVFAPVTLILAIYSFYKFGTSTHTHPDVSGIWMVLGIALILILILSFMLRVHYALTLQNRIILQEMDFRYYRLTGQSMEEMNLNLTDAQIFALRFASDEELMQLTRAVQENNLTPDTIKRSIKTWKADHRRV